MIYSERNYLLENPILLKPALKRSFTFEMPSSNVLIHTVAQVGLFKINMDIY